MLPSKTSTPHLYTGGAAHITNTSYLHSPIDGRHENANLMGLNSLSMDNENVMSIRRTKKIVKNTQDSNDEKLREYELMLKHLKSIDLSKYSFPNE